MPKRKLLLLNPPSRNFVFRDYFCTKVSKSGFYYHPLDLIYLSGRLSGVFEVSFLDCIAERLSEDEAVRRVKEIAPEIIVFLVASPSYSDDIRFLGNLKTEMPRVLFAGGGDVYRELKEKAFSMQPFLDAVFLDFSTNELLKFLLIGDGVPIDNILYRHEGRIVAGRENHPAARECDIPVPRWELVKLNAYSFPFAIRRPFATVLTDFGCAYTCTFCPMGTIGFKLRPIETVLAELELLKSLGIREILFRDQTYGANKKRTIELCKQMAERNLGFTWTAYSRVDVIDEELLEWMKKAGCHMLMFGLESASQSTADAYSKNLKVDQARKTIGLCRRYGINTGGWFILGFPEETEEDIERTIQYAIDSGVDYAVFNTLTPRLGTSFREACRQAGIIDEDFSGMDSSFGVPVWKKSLVSGERLKALKRKAFMKFYLRPGYIVRRMSTMHGFYELYNHLRNGLRMIFG